MSKELPYFRFNCSEWLTGNISYEPFELQGCFIKLCSEYWNRKNDLSLNDAKKRIGNDLLLQNLIDGGYCKITNGKISISFLNEERDYATGRSKSLSEAGRKGGLSRAKAMLKQGSSIKIKKEIKKKNKNIVPSLQDVIDYFTESGYSAQLATKAFNYYNSADWKDSNGKKVLNWKQKMQSVWFKEDNKVGVKDWAKIKEAIDRTVWSVGMQIPAEKERLTAKYNLTINEFETLYAG